MNLSHCLSHIICWKFKPKSDCFEVVAVSLDNDLCYSGGKCGSNIGLFGLTICDKLMHSGHFHIVAWFHIHNHRPVQE